MKNIRTWLKQNWGGENPWHIEVFVVVAAIAIGIIHFYLPAPSTDRSRWGEFGDFFGGMMNPLISLLILRVAVRVWVLQERELAKTTEALNQQTATNELQRFENTLFKLIEHCHNSIKKYTVRKSATGMFHPRLIGLEAIQHLVSQLKIKQHFEGQLSPTSIDSLIEEFDAYGFYEPYTVIKYAYVFSFKNCPIESRSSEYATMTYMLIGDETMFLCRFWAIASQDYDLLELLPKDQPIGT